MALTNFNDMNTLEKFGLLLQNTADPSAINKYSEQLQKEEVQQKQIDEYNRKIQQQQALQEIAPQLAGMNPVDALSAVTKITGDPTAFLKYQTKQPLQQAQIEAAKANTAQSYASAAAARQKEAQDALQQKALMQFIQMNGGGAVGAPQGQVGAIPQGGVGLTPQQQLGVLAGAIKPEEALKENQSKFDQKTKDFASLQAFQTASSDLVNTAKQVTQSPGLQAATGYIQGSDYYPIALNALVGKGQATADTNALVNNLKAGVALGKLQDLKQSSAQGASGLGALSEKELDVLINSIASLDTKQGDQQFTQQLDRLMSRVSDMEKNAVNQFNTKYGTSIVPSLQTVGAQPKFGTVKQVGK